MFVTGRAPLILAVGVAPVVLLSLAGLNAWAVAAGWVVLCAVIMGADATLAASPRRIGVERRLPERVLRDEPARSELLLSNRGSRAFRGRVRDAWQPTAGAPAERARIDIPPGERRSVVIPLRPRRRGELGSDEVVLRALGPLGIAGRQGRVASPGRIRVLPPFTARRHLPSRLARLRELDGNTSVQVRGQGTEFDSLREYVRGDDVRAIDWRATARSSTTMLRTWRPERDRHIVIVIDCGRTAAARVGDGVRLDAAMEAALLLAALATRAGDHVHLLLFDRRVRGRVTRLDGARLLPAMVDAMAPVEPSLIDTDWNAAFAQARMLTGRPSLVVLLTAHDEPWAARSFLASMTALTERTRVLVATATDAETAESEVRDADGVYAAAAAERARRDAGRVAGAVRRAGGEALVATAEALPPLVADRYLALKAAGRL